jgi:hypothetical protein
VQARKFKEQAHRLEEQACCRPQASDKRGDAGTESTNLDSKAVARMRAAVDDVEPWQRHPHLPASSCLPAPLSQAAARQLGDVPARHGVRSREAVAGTTECDESDLYSGRLSVAAPALQTARDTASNAFAPSELLSIVPSASSIT